MTNRAAKPLWPSFALSVRQPWAELILLGRKTIEVRTWETPFRGPLVLHASRKQDPMAFMLYPELNSCVFGAFVGTLCLVEIKPFTHESWSRLRSAHLVPGGMPGNAFAWHVTDARRLATPIFGPGRLGLFPAPDSLTTV
jgi:hypothetical protein